MTEITVRNNSRSWGRGRNTGITYNTTISLEESGSFDSSEEMDKFINETKKKFSMILSAIDKAGSVEKLLDIVDSYEEPEELPSMKWRKSEIYNWGVDHDYEVSKDMTKREMLEVMHLI